MKVRVDAARCVGHGRCYVLAPDVFGEDDRGHCVIEREGVPPELAEQARIGEQNCPEDAITLSAEL
jgi:ferredoxin